jgi:twitching motility protein PilT
MEITELLIHTKKNNASDLHLAAGRPPVMRINGDVLPLKTESLDADGVKALIYSVMTENQRADYERDLETDFAVQFGDDLRFRVNAFNTLNGPAAAFRSIPTKVLSLDDLKMPDTLKRLSMLSKGLILVTGPTGSGKSTTLAAMIDYVNSNSAKHILTIEDPVEFVHESKRCLVNQRELGTHTVSFSRALKSALREDPDIILVGEMRDLETIQLALTAAETGHLVMGTLHTSSAAKTIDRVIDVFPAGDKPLIRSMLSSSLEGVIAQKLIKTSDGKGRVAALEILLGTPAVRNLIREGKVAQIYSLLQIGSKVGMRTMKDSVYNLLEKGIISAEAAKHTLNMQEDLQSIPGADNKKDGKEKDEEKNKRDDRSSTPQVMSGDASGIGDSDEGDF